VGETRTIPRDRSGLPIRAIEVRAIDGPNRGLALTSERDRISIGSAEGNDVRLSDPTVSRFHLALSRDGDRVVVQDLGSTNGTRIGPVVLENTHAAVKPDVVLELGDTKLELRNGAVVMVDRGPSEFFGFVTRAPVMRRLLASIERVAKTEVSVLLLGESGTGKGRIAEGIHRASERGEGPFEIVDCAAIPPSLFASALFGHERGAFTGAEQRRAGAFERAKGGTVFLDEIGELPADMQSTLLGALERKKARPLGSEREIDLDARVISASSRDLRTAVNHGAFRLDLFYRIAVVAFDVPPLRERRDDVAAIAETFLEEAGFDGALEDVFPGRELDRLVQHHWPGNVRELRNVVLGTLALGHAPELGRVAGKTAPAELRPYREARRAVLDEFERSYLTNLLERAGGNVREAARQAKMDRNYLSDLLRRHDIR
jgi:DNA-binding NtrC family response regulator